MPTQQVNDELVKLLQPFFMANDARNGNWHVFPDALMLCHFDGASVVGDTTGSLRDVLGRQPTSAGVDFAAGRFGKGVRIGAGDSLNYPNPVSATAGTVSLWWVPTNDSTHAANRYLWACTGASFACWFNAADDTVKFTDGTNTITTAALTFGASSMHHVACTWVAGALAIYYDGALAASGATYTAPAPGATFHVGTDNAGTLPALGVIDDLLVLANALADAYAVALYNCGLPAELSASVLGDCEEGTWTPAVGGTATYTAQTGHYVKVGHLVWIACHLHINAIGTGSTTTISGLPHASAAIGVQPIHVGYFAGLTANVVFFAGNVNDGSQVITFTSTAAAASAVTDGPAIMGNGTNMYLSGCYQAAN
jgi:hypothetical protein